MAIEYTYNASKDCKELSPKDLSTIERITNKILDNISDNYCEDCDGKLREKTEENISVRYQASKEMSHFLLKVMRIKKS